MVSVAFSEIWLCLILLFCQFFEEKKKKNKHLETCWGAVCISYSCFTSLRNTLRAKGVQELQGGASGAW